MREKRKRITLLLIVAIFSNLFFGISAVSAETIAAKAAGTLSSGAIRYGFTKANAELNGWEAKEYQTVQDSNAVLTGRTRFYSKTASGDMTVHFDVETTGNYELVLLAVHESAAFSVKVNNGNALSVPKAVKASDYAEITTTLNVYETSAGTVSLTSGTNTLTLQPNGTANIRFDTLLLKPVSGGEEPTAVSSPTTVPTSEPTSAPTAEAAGVLDEDFDDSAAGRPFEGANWKFPEATNTVLEKTNGNNYLKISCTGSWAGFRTPYMYNLNGNQLFAGTDIISSFKFNFSHLNYEGEMFLARTNDNKVITDIRTQFIGGRSDEYVLQVLEGSEMRSRDIYYTFKLNSWYQLITKLNSYTGKYDLYFLDDNGNYLTHLSDIRARYDTSLTGGIVDMGQWSTNNFFAGDEVNIDEFYIANDPDFVLPAVPAPTVSPSAGPSFPPSNAVVFQNKNADDFELVIPSDTQSGTYQAGTASWGTYHNFTDLKTAKGVFHLNNVPTGEYEVYYRMPIVHEENADAVYIEVTDSLNKTGRKVFNARCDRNEPNLLNNISKTGIRSMEWIKIDGTYSFQSNIPGNLTAGVDVQTATPLSEDYYGVVRFDSVALVKVGERASMPIAQNTRIEGKIKPGAVLTGRYEYVDEKGNEEGDSVYKWYTRTSENAAWTVVSQGTTTAARGASYTVKATDKFVKFEITPKSSAENSIPGIAQSAFYELLYDSDLAPEVKNIKITGFPARLTDLSATYEYEDVNLDEEGQSHYKWIISSDPYARPYSDWEVLAEGTCNAAEPIVYNVPVSVPNGSYIRLMITPYNNEETVNIGSAQYSDFVGPFQEDEIKPEAKELNFQGKVVNAEGIAGLAIGGKAEAGYTYTYRLGLPEDTASTQIKWYRADVQTGPFTEIASGREYTPGEDDSGKFIRFGVTAAANDGKTGDTVYSPAFLVKWKLAFDDDFDYTAADGYNETLRQKWEPLVQHIELGTPLTHSARIPENVSVSDGTCKIITKKEHLDKYDFQHTWTTANIRTKESFGPYGYYETNMKYTRATGLNQSFWWKTNGGTAEQMLELDFCEAHYPYEIKTNIRRLNPSDLTTLDVSIGSYPFGQSGPATIADDFAVVSGYLRPIVAGEDWQSSVNNDAYQVFYNNQQIRSTISVPNQANVGTIYLTCCVLPGGFAGALVEADAHNSVIQYDYVRYYEEIGVTQNGDNTYEMGSIALNSAIEEASGLLSDAVIGTQPGNYPETAKTKLQNALNTAKKVTNHYQKGAAANTLNKEIKAFRDSLIGNPEVLKNMLSVAQNIFDTVKEGNGYAQCPKNYLNSLKASITLTQNLLKEYPAQERLDAQVASLGKAIDKVIANQGKSGAVSSNGIIIDFSEVSGALEITEQTRNGAFLWSSPLSRQTITFDAYDCTLQILDGTRAVSGDKKYGWSVSKLNTEQASIDGYFDFSGLQTDQLMKFTFTHLGGKSVGILNGRSVIPIENVITSDSYESANAGYTGSGSYTVKYAGTDMVTVYTNDPSGLCIYSNTQTEPPVDEPENNEHDNWTPNIPGGIFIPPNNNNNAVSVHFTDIAGHWAEKEILALAEQNIINGKNETQYMPEDTVTRAEFAAMNRRALGLNPSIYQGAFGDIGNGSWYANEIQAAVNAGIMSGDADGNFRPNDPISRQEMAKVIVNAYLTKHTAQEIETGDIDFTDSGEIAEWAREPVARAAALGLVNGMPDGTFAPNDNMTRAQAAAVIYRLIAYSFSI